MSLLSAMYVCIKRRNLQTGLKKIVAQGSENSAIHKNTLSEPLSPTNNPRVSTARLKNSRGEMQKVKIRSNS